MGFVLPPSKLYVHALFLDELTDLINAEGRVNREGGERVQVGRPWNIWTRKFGYASMFVVSELTR